MNVLVAGEVGEKLSGGNFSQLRSCQPPSRAETPDTANHSCHSYLDTANHSWHSYTLAKPGGKRLPVGRLLLGETDRNVKSCPSGTVTLGKESYLRTGKVPKK